MEVELCFAHSLTIRLLVSIGWVSSSNIKSQDPHGDDIPYPKVSGCGNVISTGLKKPREI